MDTAPLIEPPLPVWEEPVRGGYPPPSIYKLAGAELVKIWQRKEGVKPPMSHFCGMDYDVMDDGTARFFMPASPSWLSSQGVISGGVLGIPADAALGCVIWMAMPPATGLATSELSMNFVRPATAESKVLSARGRLIHMGQTLALSEAIIEDEKGVLAHSTARCVLFPIEPAMLGDEEFDQAGLEPEPVYDTPDPYQREPRGEILERASWEQVTGLEVLDRQIKGELPQPPIHHLTGIRPIAASEGTVRFTMPSSAWFSTSLRTIMGGFIWLQAYSALASAIQTTLPAGTAHVPVDLKVNFLRPIYPDTGDITAVGRVIHKGRTLAVADAEVFSGDSKLVAVARGTSQVLTGRSAVEEA